MLGDYSPAFRTFNHYTGSLMQTKKSPQKEDIAWALDYLPYGKSDDSRPIYQRKPLIQAIGESQFVLMELIPKEDIVPVIPERLYIGEGDREKIDHVKGRLRYTELSNAANLEPVSYTHLTLPTKRIV